MNDAPLRAVVDEEARLAKEAELDALLAEFERYTKYNRLLLYAPGRPLAPTDKQREFHDTGGLPDVRFRVLSAGNQQGKTLAGGMEFAFHMTGLYPEWWRGYRFRKPIKAWVSGVTGESTRDNPQAMLLGDNKQWGTGTIPMEKMLGSPIMARGGVPDLVDSFQCQHVSGGVSVAWFKSYEKGREKWQGKTLDLIWYDEEPPKDIWDEGMARLINTGGLAFMTFTPLLGMTEVVRLFFEPDKDDPSSKERRLVHMGIDDATFYTQEQREREMSRWDASQRRARLEGLPMLGSGLILPVPDEILRCEPFEMPKYYRRIIGIDFGVAHPTAAACLAWDPDSDVVYLYDGYKREAPEIALHAAAIKARGGDVFPIAWPHDGLKSGPKTSDPRSGLPTKEHYRKFGLNMLPESARYDDDKGGRQAVEPIIAELLERCKTERFKVLHLPGTKPFFDEKASWHRKDGKPVDYNDDFMKAVLYALMSLRYARPAIELNRQTRAVDDYDPFDWRAD